MEFTFETTVPAPIESVYRFYRNPANFPRIMDDVPGFVLLHQENLNRVGGTVWFQQTVFRILPIVVGFRQVAADPPRRFVFRLIHGPFDTFQHVHAFERREEGTRVTEEMNIELPWYFGGKYVMTLAGTRCLTDIFEARGRRLRTLAEENRLDRFFAPTSNPIPAGGPP